MTETSLKPGFTLAELLIALALLGIIAAFTIPKVLQSSAENEKVAKLRETVATIEQAWYNARATNNVTGTTLYDNLESRLNTVQSSTQEPSMPGEALAGLPTHPCNSFVMPGYVVLHNGVVISLLRMTNYTATELLVPGQRPNNPICIDINGKASPNLQGQDVFLGTFNPWGDFDVAQGAVYNFSENGKAFHWGSEGETVYADDGSPVNGWPAPWNSPQTRTGYWLTR